MLSLSNLTFADLWAFPSVIRQPATFPELLTLNTSKIFAYPRIVSLISGFNNPEAAFFICSIKSYIIVYYLCSTSFWLAESLADAFALTLKPITDAFEASANITSLSVTAPTPECRTKTLTSSLFIFSKA